MIVTINSSHGHCTADTYSGVMLEDHLDELFGAKPICFNFAEWRKRYPGEQPVGIIDILDLGFIATNGEYCEPEEAWRKMREIIKQDSTPFTVILAYPDYMSPDGPEYCVDLVDAARDVNHAIHIARHSVYNSNHVSMDDPLDLAVVGIIEGKHKVYGE